jgi:DNA-directed RNA polymerase subunit M/transcription elongation factor TFIIS
MVGKPATWQFNPSSSKMQKASPDTVRKAIKDSIPESKKPIPYGMVVPHEHRVATEAEKLELARKFGSALTEQSSSKQDPFQCFSEEALEQVSADALKHQETCRHSNISYELVQMRSADEAPDVFYKCSDCGKVWKNEVPDSIQNTPSSWDEEAYLIGSFFSLDLAQIQFEHIYKDAILLGDFLWMAEEGPLYDIYGGENNVKN